MPFRAVILQLVFLAACTAVPSNARDAAFRDAGTSHPDAASDAGLDAGADAARDVFDGGVDAGALDGALDAGPDDAGAAPWEAAPWEAASIYLMMVDRFADGSPNPGPEDRCFNPAHPRRFHGGDLVGLR
ncbi:MAG: hypothetical protein AAGE52_41705, partial [Myxococcota bacterium]